MGVAFVCVFKVENAARIARVRLRPHGRAMGQPVARG